MATFPPPKHQITVGVGYRFHSLHFIIQYALKVRAKADLPGNNSVGTQEIFIQMAYSKFMPILPLNHPMPMVAVTNIMLRPDFYPDGVAKANNHIAETTRDLFRPYFSDGWSIENQGLLNLVAAPGATQDSEELAKCWRDGISMGVTYMLLFALMKRRPELASWKSAMKLVEHIRKGTDLPGSHGYLSKVKTKYASVAHLWAANLVQNRFEYVDESRYSASAAFHFFLMDSERLLQVGRKFVPKREGAKPLLDGDEWCVPDDWQWPQWQPGYPRLDLLAIPQLPDDVDTIVNPTGRPRTTAGEKS